MIDATLVHWNFDQLSAEIVVRRETYVKHVEESFELHIPLMNSSTVSDDQRTRYTRSDAQ